VCHMTWWLTLWVETMSSGGVLTPEAQPGDAKGSAAVCGATPVTADLWLLDKGYRSYCHGSAAFKASPATAMLTQPAAPLGINAIAQRISIAVPTLTRHQTDSPAAMAWSTGSAHGVSSDGLCSAPDPEQ
jgi:hypothetical protein